MELGRIEGKLMDFDLVVEKAHQDKVLAAIKAGLVTSAHDLAEGGLAVALAESAFGNDLGIEVAVDMPLNWLFSETQSRYVISVKTEKTSAFKQLFDDLCNRNWKSNK